MMQEGRVGLTLHQKYTIAEAVAAVGPTDAVELLRDREVVVVGRAVLCLASPISVLTSVAPRIRASNRKETNRVLSRVPHHSGRWFLAEKH